MTGIAVLAFGTGPLFALGTGLVIGSVPPERAGSAASMSETGNYFGGVPRTGPARRRWPPSSTAPHAHGTSDSLAGALAASSHLSAAQASATLHTAREAFTASLHATGLIAAVIFAALSVLVLAMRPATREPQEQEQEQEQPQPQEQEHARATVPEPVAASASAS